MVKDETDQRGAVLSWRYEQARKLGLTGDEATRFAEGHGDIALLRRLIQAGCEPTVAARIVG